VVIAMTEFREGEPVPSAGENANDADGTNERRARVLATARANIARINAIEKDGAQDYVAAANAMPDLATLQARWKTGGHLSDHEFYEMRRLEVQARHAPALPSPKQPTVNRSPLIDRRANENLMAMARKHNLELKLKNGQRWTNAERVEWWNVNARELMFEVDRLVGKRKITEAIAIIVKEFAIVAIQQTQNREKLEDRIAALEPKPRIRVKAIQQVIA